MDDEPELEGYQPHEQPMRGNRARLAMRVIGLVTLGALVLPGILAAWGIASSTASRTCAVYADVLAPEAVGFDSRFELGTPETMGWNCYARFFDGTEILIASMGLIPGGAKLPSGPVDRS